MLAAMLAEWRLVGWAAMMGRRPASDDLIVPLPPDAIARRRRRTGDAFRGHDYSGKKWREHDMPLLGWRYREPYATKSTFITLVIEDGAKADVIRDRVTHTKAARDAFSGYDRGPHWIEACGEVGKLQLTRRLATSFATAGQLLELSEEKSGGGGSRRIEFGREDPRGSSRSVDKRGCDRYRRRSSRPSAVTRRVTGCSRRRLRAGTSPG
jgi:hypothetical protein